MVKYLFQINIIYKLKEECLTVDMFQEEINTLERDDILVTLQDLNVLELCLLIAMKHHSEIYEGQSMNFEMVFSRYIKFVKTNSNIQSVPRSVVMKALEHLQVIIHFIFCNYERAVTSFKLIHKI